MDTTTSKNAAKKCCQLKNHAAANSLTSTTISNVNPPVIITLNESATTTTITDNSELPDQEIEVLGRLTARRAARKVWQHNYVEEQRQLKAEAQLSATEATPSTAKLAGPIQTNQMDTATSSVIENATITPLQVPLSNSTINVRQEVDNCYYKQQLRTAPIAANIIIKPPVPT